MYFNYFYLYSLRIVVLTESNKHYRLNYKQKNEYLL